MSAARVATKTLPSGAAIPVIGLGVYQSHPGEETYNAVVTALRLGYRHIDSAQAYRNEADVGRAVRDSGVPREQVFVTSKIYAGSWNYDRVLSSVRASNEKLGLGYIDLFLLHSPSDNVKRADAWRALEDLQREGVLRDIGVSNFGEKHLRKLAETWRSKPAVNQVELHPWLTRSDLRAYHEEQGIHLEAYSPLARAAKLQDPVLQTIAKEVNASGAQVLVAWSLAKGFITLPKSVHETRIKENLEATDVALSDEQVRKLDALDEYFVTGWDPIRDDPI